MPRKMPRLWSLCLHTAVLYIVSASGLAQSTQRCDYFYGVPSEHLLATDGDGNILRIRGIRDHSDKDFVLGGLFPVHFDSSDGVQCGEVRREGGLERVEAMLFAIDCVNSDSHLLQNLTLGYDIRDTESVGLDEALDLIIIASQSHKDEACSYEQTLNTFHGNASEHSSPRLVPTLGLIGAAASRVSLPIASLGRLFHMPQISYSSGSPYLSNRDRYTYFYRTVIPTNIEVRALISFIIEFQWNHISIVYSNNAYGTAAKDDMVKVAEQYGICIDKNLEIPDAHPDYKAIADGLNSSSAEVVIVFASQRNALYLLGNYTSITHHRKLTWMASGAWSQAISVISQFNRTLAGMFGTTPSSKHLKTFNKYFEKLTIESNLRDPWFPDYFSALTKCSLNSSCNHAANIIAVHDYQQEYSIPRVIDAVYAFANALQDYLDDNCDQPVVWNRANYSCKGQKRALNGLTMLEYLKKVHFDGVTQSSIAFNDQGYISNGSYDILNYKVFNHTYQLKTVGIWEIDGTSLTEQNMLGKVVLYDRESIQFGLNDDGNVIHQPHNSQCGRCRPGEFVTPTFSSCCGICEPCHGQMFSNHTQATACSECDEYMWGNRPTQGSSHCVMIKETFLKLSDPWAIAMEILSLLGLSAVGVVATVFGIYWNTPVIKSSGREQMILLLTGISLSYVLAFIYVSPPVLPVCIFQHFGLWFCFSLMFGALMLKIIRVAWIFLRQSTPKTLHFQKPKYQILFTCMVVAGQLLLVLVSILIHHYPQVLRSIRVNSKNSLDFPQVIISCSQGHLAMVILSLVYETIIIAVTTVFGIISFKYPDNFNEAKHISFCTFALIVIWLAFIPSYFATSTLQEVQNAAISFSIIMTASAVLVCMFGPRIYIALFCPEKNTRTSVIIQLPSQHKSEPCNT